MKKITFAFAGITLGMIGLFAPTAQATGPRTDCSRVAAADRSLCRAVRAQVAYAFATEGALITVPNGRALVKEITHDGLTRREMHAALVGEASGYVQHVTGARSVAVDLGSLKKYHGSDAQYVVGFEDADGKPGGKRLDRVEIDLP